MLTENEIPPKGVDIQTGEILQVDTEAVLIDRLQDINEAIRTLRAEKAQIETTLLERMEMQGKREANSQTLVARIEKISDKAALNRDFVLGLHKTGVLTGAEMALLLPANINVNLRGWDMLERRGLQPSQNGERTPGGARIKIFERRVDNETE